jgi:hypothetical protein
MLIRLSLLLALVVTTSPAAFRASTNIFISEEVDSDEDGVDDEMESLLGTNPEDPDTDDDGWDDLTEIVSGSDPSDPTDIPQDLSSVGDQVLPGNQTLRLKVQELLNTRRLAQSPVAAPVRTNTDSSKFSLRYFYVGKGLPSLAVEVCRSDLKAGSFLLLWRHHIRWNPLQIEQRYTVSVRTDDGRTIAEWKTPAPVDAQWQYVGLPFSLRPSDEGRLLTLSLIPDEDSRLEYFLADFVAVPAGIEADVNRDGIIAAQERPATGKPLRHWVNDDDDQGECGGRADLPGLPMGQADHSQAGIDGLRDLVDFLPLNLNLSRVTRLLPPSDGFRYYVTHPESAVQIALSGLTPTKAGAIHREADLIAFGPKAAAGITSAEILKPDADGRIELPATFIERVTKHGHGVILAEGAKASQQALQIEIRLADRTIATLEQPMAIVPVETMYRHVNLAGLTTDYFGQRARVKKLGRPRQVGDPEGLPDAETNARWVVMIHGYNVPGDLARSWHAETFKRLYVLGSDARFVGLTWNGDTGLDYHLAVYHAFQAGDEIPRALSFLDASRTLLIGHSLGNIVASQAVQAGFTPARYFLLNAALPIEALSGTASDPSQAMEMTEQLWRPYERRLFASDWAKLQSLGDQRRAYTWTNAFSKVRSLDSAINCYSPGEDVTNCPPDMTSASVLSTLWSGRAIDYGVWKTQELVKGVNGTRSLGALAMQNGQGGWGFNPAWRGRYVSHGSTKAAGGHFERLTPSEAARLTKQQLVLNPFFGPFMARWLHQPRPARPSPLLDSPHVRYELLATAIPALSFAAGAAAIPRSPYSSRIRNFDLEKEGREAGGRWPTEGHTAKNTPGRWLHSDFKNAALPFVHPLFAKMISEGSLR